MRLRRPRNWLTPRCSRQSVRSGSVERKVMLAPLAVDRVAVGQAVMIESTDHTRRSPSGDEEWRADHAIRPKPVFETQGASALTTRNIPKSFETAINRL